MGVSNYLLGSGENPSAMPAPQTYSPERERQARANGFHSAEEMMLWAKQRNQQSGGTVSHGPGVPSVDAMMSWHPANMFNKILGAWQGATKDNQ